jgi:alkylation response protein AidB-like acyl-CoA dehydrogenase
MSDVLAELCQWVEEAWDADLALREWRIRLFDAGWACPAWPRERGGLGLPAGLAEGVASELAQLGVPGPPEGVGMHLAAPTLLEHGSDDLNVRYLRSIGTGQSVWCQLFSEPGAGSDLAGLTTRAVLDGDEWIVSGQKVWNTGAAQADWGLLVARTDWDQPKHSGLTYFVLPMRQPGVEVRPLRQINGHASFNEVFLDEARVPAENVIGSVGAGWRVALTTLAHERRLASVDRPTRRRGSDGRAWREAMAERVAVSEPHKWYPQRAGRVDLLAERAVAAGRHEDPVVRQQIATVIGMAKSARWTAQRAAAARALGRPPGPEGSLGKLATSRIARGAARAHSLIAGASAMLSGPESSVGGVIAEILVSVPAQSIAGGTDEIQHNILAERVLGLPKEPEVDRDRPFRLEARNA